MTTSKNLEKETAILLGENHEDSAISEEKETTMSSVNLPVISSEGSLSRYLDEINKFPYLSQDEEYKLAKDWVEHGDVSAAHRLVTSHLRLVAKIAMTFRHYGLPVIELISEGNIGLMQAVRKFDHKKGFRLSTYAMWWIKASIQEYILRSWSLVKIGTTAAQKKLFFNLKRLKGNLSKVDDSALAPDEIKYIANELEVSEQEVREMDSRLMQGDTSLNAPLLGYDDSGTAEMQDFVEEESDNQEIKLVESDEAEHRHQILVKAMSTLNEREQAILQARRLLENPETLEDLSQRFGISRERVRQIEARAMEKLQTAVLDQAKEAA